MPTTLPAIGDVLTYWPPRINVDDNTHWECEVLSFTPKGRHARVKLYAPGFPERTVPITRLKRQELLVAHEL